MNSPLLNRLVSDEFTDSVGFVLPPGPLRRMLQLSADVRSLAAALRFGQVTKEDVREFVERLLRDFRPGELFRHDVALAAVAVALEHWSSSFAEDYLLDLARVERPEFRASFRVARECLKARAAFPRTQVKMARFGEKLATPNRPPEMLRLLPRIEWPQFTTLGSPWVRCGEAIHAKT